jgi:hypothetical protein
MNLFKVFGAERIVKSTFVERISLETDDLPRDMSSPFAIGLSVAAELAGVAGCDRLIFEDKSPTFCGECSKLEFTPGGPFDMIGKFTLRPVHPTYWLFSPKQMLLAISGAAGAFGYRNSEQIVAKESLEVEDNKGSNLLIEDLHEKACRCPNMVRISRHQRIGLRAPALVLLAADSPRTTRVFPSTSFRIWEAIVELGRHCTFWRDEKNRTTHLFTEKFSPALSPIITISAEEFASIPFSGERLEKRVLLMMKRGSAPRIAGLGFSWLAPMEAYTSEAEGSDRRLKARPEWPIETGSFGLVLLEGIVESCDAYLSTPQGDTGPSGDLRAFYHTQLTCQLQEVDWWLGAKQAVAACETCVLFDNMSPFQFEPENATRVESPTLTLFFERRAVRAILVFRALLVGMLLQMGLDNSAFVDTELGDKVVLLR